MLVWTCTVMSVILRMGISFWEGLSRMSLQADLRLSNLPGTFSAADHSYTTVISGNGKHYRVIVIPCWTKKVGNDRSVEVGFKIVEASWEWAEFVLNTALPPGAGDDFSFQA